ncbi:hypothetical protein EYV94_02615 [Puteibacter caeruleilacunae]|nr:hypothetical protein EYV94_02615 [Puteibacter caeruleilacunae]
MMTLTINQRMAVFTTILSLWICIPTGVFSQDKKTQKRFEQALGEFRASRYTESLDNLDKIIAKTPDYIDAHLLKAEIYHITGNELQEIASYKKALQINPDYNPRVQYLLALAQYRAGMYTDASFLMKDYTPTPKLKKQVELLKENLSIAIQLFNDSLNIDKHKLFPENSGVDEYFPKLSADDSIMIYTRRINHKVSQDRIIQQEDLFFRLADSTGWQDKHAIHNINTLDNEGAHCISSDGKHLFFTACNRRNSRGRCDIYYAFRSDSVWSKPINIGSPVNTPAWESQPALSANGEYLYYTSNRPGGYGKKDIWRARFIGTDIHGKPKFAKPENLGDVINTPGDEVCPFIHHDDIHLYFSSDKHPGLGRQDIFVSELTNNQWSKPKNIGYPINTHHDETGLFINSNGQKGYLASGKAGFDKISIYEFDIPKEKRPQPVNLLQGMVVDAHTHHPIQTQVSITPLVNQEKVDTFTTNIDGSFLYCLKSGLDYAIHITAPGYLFYSEQFQVNTTSQPIRKYISVELQPLELAEKLILKNIYYEFDSAVLQKESTPELKRLIQLLNQNPTLHIMIEGHTDNTGNQTYNLDLSTQRAKSVYQYLIDYNIKEERLAYKGYGDQRPIADNDTDIGKAQNRRTEIRFIKENNK